MADTTHKRIFSKNLNHYMELNKKTQTDIITDLGINKSAISSWCNGNRLPRMDKVKLLADYLQIEISDLIEEKQINTDNSIVKSVKIPVMGYVKAGIPLEAVENIVDYEEISSEMARHGEYFGLKIKGDSMQPRICDGDVVIVNKQSDADTGDIVIALINGYDATCKKLIKHTKGVTLVSLNPNYEPMYYTNEDISETPVDILGKVVELRGKF